MDDMTPEQVLTGSSKDFGMPTMSEKEWKRFYDQPHEKKKLQDFKKKQKELTKEVYDSHNLVKTKDGET